MLVSWKYSCNFNLYGYNSIAVVRSNKIMRRCTEAAMIMILSSVLYHGCLRYCYRHPLMCLLTPSLAVSLVTEDLGMQVTNEDTTDW